MILMQSEVKKDIDHILNRISQGDGPVPSQLKAFKLGAIFPMTCLGFYAFALLCIVSSFIPPEDSNWKTPVLHYLGGSLAFGGITVFLALGMSAILYSSSLMYLSLPIDVRKNSLVIAKIRRIYRTAGAFFMVVNFSYAMVCIFLPDAFYGAPFLMIISFLIMQVIVSSELTRFGIKEVITKMSNVFNKI